MSETFDVRTERRARPPWLAPVVVGLAALPVGAGLALGITGRQDDPVGADAADVPSTTVAAATTTVQSVEVTAATPSTDVSSTAVAESGPPEPDTARINGVLYTEVSSCVAFPNSNPTTGVGDAGINVSLHLMESDAGAQVDLERWSYDFGGAVGVYPFGRKGGIVDTFDLNQTEPHVIGFAGGSFEVELGSMLTPGDVCPTLVVEGGPDAAFTAYGVVQVCEASDGQPFEAIYTFQGGTTLTRIGQLGSTGDSYEGVFEHQGNERVLSDGSLSVDDFGSTQLTAAISPGLFGENDTLTFDIGGLAAAQPCTPEQEQAAR